MRPSDHIGDTLAVMIRKRVHRVVVADVVDGGVVDGVPIVGILEALDLFSFMSFRNAVVVHNWVAFALIAIVAITGSAAISASAARRAA